jgi:hypothetical protein
LIFNSPSSAAQGKWSGKSIFSRPTTLSAATKTFSGYKTDKVSLSLGRGERRERERERERRGEREGQREREKRKRN